LALERRPVPTLWEVHEWIPTTEMWTQYPPHRTWGILCLCDNGSIYHASPIFTPDADNMQPCSKTPFHSKVYFTRNQMHHDAGENRNAKTGDSLKMWPSLVICWWLQ
jgi:hypothetical protein